MARVSAEQAVAPSSHPVGPTHSEPDESSSTVPALMLMAMGMTPLSCSWRLCLGGGRGGGPGRPLSLAEEARDEPVPCSRGSRRRLLFSLMVGRHFFLRMPAGHGGRHHRVQVERANKPGVLRGGKLPAQCGVVVGLPPYLPLWGWAEGPGRGPRAASRASKLSPFSRGRSSGTPGPPLSLVVAPKSPGQGTFPSPGPPSGGKRSG